MKGGTGKREDIRVREVRSEKMSDSGLREFTSRKQVPHELVGNTSRVTLKFGISVVKYPYRPSSYSEGGSFGENRRRFTKETARNDMNSRAGIKGLGGSGG